MNATRPAGVRVWDLPTRLCHWALAVLIALQYATGEFGVLDWNWHFRLGYATLALLVFRVLWGVCGSQTSRFGEFVRGPRVVLRYVSAQFSTNPQRSIGHNPLGGWSVLALLACTAVQTLSGLFASDELADDGPLAAHVGARTVRWLTRVHAWNQNLLLALVVLHVAAVLLYLVLKREDLIVPMLTGRKPLAAAPALRFASPWLALGLFAASCAAVAALVWWA